MKIDTSKRTNTEEIMDNFELQGEELDRTLKDLDRINKWLGGNKITLQGIKKLIKNHSIKKQIHIADLGCGNGAVLREIAKWGKMHSYNFKLTGIDANAHAIEIAQNMSKDFEEITFRNLDIFSEEFTAFKCDILLCTLTLHHFKDQEISKLLSLFNRQAKVGVVINDLERSKLAYRLFQAFCKVFINNEIARKDGLTSILRGFKKSDLQKFAADLPSTNHQIDWKWAFRYQWIIQKKIV